MPGRSLPNYDEYLDKLKLYAKACQITIERKDYAGDAAFVPTRRVIIIDKDLPESTEIACLLHEFGHQMDENLLNPETEHLFDKAYTKYYRGKASRKDHAKVLATERKAWAFSRSIAKKLRIPLGVWFDKEEAEALASYSGLSPKS